MKSRRNIALAGILIALTVGMALRSAHALPAQRTLADRIATVMIMEPNHWPWLLAKLFADSLPYRIKHPLVAQTQKTIRAFVLRLETPYGDDDNERIWLCAASCGAGGCFVSLIAERAEEYRHVWDTLIPPSIISSTMELVDLNRDSVPETILTGQLLHSRQREWAILQWSDGQMRLMAPRLDMPSSYILDNRLIGDSLRILDVTDNGVPRLGLWRQVGDGEQSDQSHSDYREFFYVDSIGGYVPNAGYVR